MWETVVGCRCQKPNLTRVIKSKRNIAGSSHRIWKEPSGGCGKDATAETPGLSLLTLCICFLLYTVPLFSSVVVTGALRSRGRVSASHWHLVSSGEDCGWPLERKLASGSCRCGLGSRALDRWETPPQPCEPRDRGCYREGGRGLGRRRRGSPVAPLDLGLKPCHASCPVLSWSLAAPYSHLCCHPTCFCRRPSLRSLPTSSKLLLS